MINKQTMSDIGEKLVSSTAINDSSAKDIFAKIVESKFVNKYSNSVAAELRKGNLIIHVDERIEKYFNAMVFPKSGSVHVNFASVIKDPTKPLDGVYKLKEIFAILLKGSILHRLVYTNKTSLVSRNLITVSSELFLEQMIKALKKELDMNRRTESEAIQIQTLILFYFLNNVVGSNPSTFKMLITSILLKNIVELTALELSNEIDRVLGSNVISSLGDLSSSLSNMIGKPISESTLSTNYFINYRAGLFGLIDFADFVASNYAVITTETFNGRIMNSDFTKLTNSFKKTVEQNV
jgi:hypothetical protein